MTSRLRNHRGRLGALFIAGGLVGMSPATAAEATCDTSPLFVRGATAPLVGPGRFDMAVQEGRIVALGRSGKVRKPPAARVIDAKGAALLPGLIDAHAHFFELGGPRLPRVTADPAKEAFPITLRATLRSGVTTARAHLFDVQHGPRLQAESDDPCVASPRLQVGGPGLFPESAARGRQVWGVSGAQDAIAKLKEIQASGALWVAIHDPEKLSDEGLAAIVSAARGHGLRVMVAAESKRAILAGLRVAADTVEYGPTDATLDDPEIRAAIEAAEGRTAISAPLSVHLRPADLERDASDLKTEDAYEFMPADVAAHLKAGLLQAAEKPDPTRATTAKDRLTRFSAILKSSAPVVLSADVGSPNLFHRDAIWHEITAWRRAGADWRRPLQAATATNADLLRRPDLGRLQPGATADFILYAGDLSEPKASVDKLRTVVKGGVVYVDKGRWVAQPAPRGETAAP